MINYSKKYKLPKSQWQKNKSKFVFCRIMENNKPKFIDSVGIVKDIKWWERFKNFINKLLSLCRINRQA